MYPAVDSCQFDQRHREMPFKCETGECSVIRLDDVPDSMWGYEPSLCNMATMRGHLACLIEFWEQYEYHCDKNTCATAALYGQLDCLKYLHENGCPWDSFTCYHAAGNGHLDCLKYAHENGCPWDEGTCMK